MKAVIFDFDGTIVDSLAAVIQVVETITKRPTPFTEAEIAKLQHLDPLQIALSLGVQKWKIPWLLFRGRRMFRDHMQDVRIHEGMTELIQMLHANQVPMHVLSSNSTSNVEKYLSWHKLDTYFTSVYGGAGVLGKTRKLHRLFDEQKVEPAGSWYIGDETRDIIGAHGAGLRIISVSWGYNSRAALEHKNPEALVDSPTEIIDVLKQDGLLQ